MPRRVLDSAISRRALLAATSLALTPRPTGAEEGLLPASQETSGDWPTYGADLANTRSAANPQITSATVSDLRQSWKLDLGGAVSATPIVVEETIFIGDYSGRFQAIDRRAGRVVWTYDTGAAVREPNLDIDLGILGSATVADDFVFLGDATATVHALDANTGELRWKRKIDKQPAACIWSSPLVAADTLYVGVGSVAKEPGFRGSVVALDAATGAERWRTFAVEGEADGGGIFAVPAIDLERGLLYVGTQNAYSPTPAPYGNPTSLLALDIATGEQQWVFAAPPGGGPDAPTEDVGFSASPNLFIGRIFGHERALIGCGQKSGIFWLLDRETGEFIWRTEVSPPGFLGGMEGTSAVAGTVIVVPATDWSDVDGPASGLVAALDVGTGRILWTARQTAPTTSPVAVSGDLAFSGSIDGVLRGFALRTGAEVWRADLGASISSGIAIAGESIVVAAATPVFAPFVKAGTSLFAFTLGATDSDATPPIGDGTSF